MISIRGIRQKDIAVLASLADDSAIETLVDFAGARKGVNSNEALFDNILKKHQNGWMCTYIIEDDGTAVGCVHSTSNDMAPDVYKLNCWIAAPYKDRGFAKEAMRQLMEKIRDENTARSIQSLFIAAVSSQDDAGLKMIRELGFSKNLRMKNFRMPVKNVYTNQQLEEPRRP